MANPYQPEAKVSEWRNLGDGIQIREWRPRTHPATECREYDRIYRPMKVDWEGGCRNYDVTRVYCIFCAAHVMSMQAKGVPYDGRWKYDQTMGW